jgi:LPXTG-motif cell wall-anchored protein
MLRVVLRTGVTLLLSGLLMAAGLLVAPTASPAAAPAGRRRSCWTTPTPPSPAGCSPERSSTPPGPSSAAVIPPCTSSHRHGGEGHRARAAGLLSPDSGASCGLELSGDGPFVVFATRSTQLGGAPFADLGHDQYAASLCGGTAPLAPAIQADLQALAPDPAPEIPVPGAAGTDARGTGDTNSFVPALAATGTLALLAAGGLLVRRRRAAS